MLPQVLRTFSAPGTGSMAKRAPRAARNSWPDIMLMLGKGMTYNHAVFPTKTGMPMPAKSDATDRDYLDFHIVCKGDPFAFWYKIEYTVQPTQLPQSK